MYNMISDAYYSIEDYDQSLENINLAIKNIDSEPIFYQRRANCYLKLKNIELAKMDYDFSVNNSPSLYNRIFNLFARASFFQNDIEYPIKSLFDYTEIINILKLENSTDFVSDEDKKQLLIRALSARSEVLKKLNFFAVACEDFKSLCDLGDCEMFNENCK